MNLILVFIRPAGGMARKTSMRFASNAGRHSSEAV
ncbi:hypothetical protein GGE12_007005 [Rhizobium mongolense]|uniref:Uncharacterized protein n=1 Tax=Rhizobium mongolense TaxID=57676 RepID=A0A7W6RV35_9HYPH|nr:hypothetical protein [Rhizobium mongolense]